MIDPTNQRSPQPTNVLVVDDEEVVCEMVSVALVEDGYRVEVANDGQEALRLLRTAPFDVIVSDIRMPGMDGLTLLKEAKRMTPEPLVVIMTGHAHMGYVLDALRSGAAGFLIKPFSIEELRFSVRTALDRRETQEELVRLRTLSRVAEISRELVRTLELKPLARLIVQIAAGEAKADRVSLMLIGEESHELSIVASKGIPRHVVRSTRMRVGEGIAGYVAQKGQVLVINKQNDLEPSLQRRLRLPDVGPAMSIPLVSLPLLSEGKPIGVLNVCRPKSAPPFSNSDVNLFSILADQATIALRNAQLFQKVRDLYLGAIQSIALTIQAKDAYTHGHSNKVAEYTVALARAMGLSSETVENLRVAALLHDIGKVGVREEVLNKPGPLTPEEYDHVKTHPLVAERILRPITELGDIVDCIKHEHENWDGSGYPSGLQDGDIPLGSRIIAVVDAFHAMTSDRPYRKAMSIEKAVRILREGAGKQWDPRVVEAWLDIVPRLCDGYAGVVRS
jgi:putative nucleotidyltransferase with HDIG domain